MSPAKEQAGLPPIRRIRGRCCALRHRKRAHAAALGRTFSRIVRWEGAVRHPALAIQRRATAAAPQALEAQNRALREENEALTRAAAERAPTTLNVRVAWRPNKQAR